MKIGTCSVCGRKGQLGIDDRCRDCLQEVREHKLKYGMPDCGIRR